MWITNIVWRNIFQIKFKYWSSSLNLVPHVKDWDVTWWHNQMETFAGLLVLCTGFPTQRPVTLSFDVFFDLCLNKLLSKQLWGWWFETLLCPSWCRSNESWAPAVLEACGVNLYEICFLSKKKKPDTFPLCLQWAGWMTLNVQLCLSTSGTKCTK